MKKLIFKVLYYSEYGRHLASMLNTFVYYDSLFAKFGHQLLLRIAKENLFVVDITMGIITR